MERSAVDGDTSGAPSRTRRLAPLWGALVGAAAGGAVGVGVYLLLAPVLEASSGWIRELQGFSWNLVPGLLIVGALVGGGIGVAVRTRATQGRHQAEPSDRPG
jgi:hypothetical protein